MVADDADMEGEALPVDVPMNESTITTATAPIAVPTSAAMNFRDMSPPDCPEWTLFLMEHAEDDQAILELVLEPR